MTMFYIPAQSLTDLPGSATMLRQQFLASLLQYGTPRVLWTPKRTDTTTSLDESQYGRTLTWDATIAARLSALGLGYSATFDGAANFAQAPDAAELSFGNATVDQAFSIVAVANVTDTATTRQFVCKFKSTATAAREWDFVITTADFLRLELVDESLVVAPSCLSNSVITQGAWGVFGATYSAATGGATAANDMALYQNGVAMASTATNAGTYVAMENTTAPITIGATINPANFMQGSMALVFVTGGALSAADHWAIYRSIQSYFGL